ncbi:MAG: hypothetical protein AAF488_14050 [Planctomycetota bacterium]
MNRMNAWQAFDALLRGKVSAEDRVRLLRLWVLIQAVAAALFGMSLGVYSLTSRAVPEWNYLWSGAVKMPLLLLLTTVVTCPSLYVFGALRGLRFTATQFVAMLLAGHTIFAGVLASLATVVAFFGLTTKSYSFMVLLTVATCALAGFLGLVAFVKALRATEGDVSGPADPRGQEPLPARAPSAEADEAIEIGGPSSRARLSIPRPGAEPNIWQILGWWLVLYGFVGVQMGWILRPFLGAPDLPWEFVRGKSGSFLESVFHHIGRLFAG